MSTYSTTPIYLRVTNDGQRIEISSKQQPTLLNGTHYIRPQFELMARWFDCTSYLIN